MANYRYHEPQRYDRATATRALHADDPAVVCDALVGVTFHDGDWRWVQAIACDSPGIPPPTCGD